MFDAKAVVQRLISEYVTQKRSLKNNTTSIQ